jgi:hypothetical protein
MAALRPRRKPAPKPQRFDPLAPQFKYQKGFNKAVRQQANSQVAPALGDVNQRIGEAQGAHTTRNSELQGWYGYAANTGQAANNALGDRMQSILGSLQTQGGASGDALSAALRQSMDQTAPQAAALGVQGPQTDPAYADALRAYQGENNLSLVGDIGSGLQRAAADQGILGITGREAADAESRRAQSTMSDLTKERTGIKQQIPGIRSQIAEQLRNQELARAGQVFQQNLAQSQFGLDKKQFGLSKAQFRQTKKEAKFQHGLANKQFGEDVRHNQVGEAQNQQQIANQYSVDMANVATQNAQLQQNIDKAQTAQDKEVATAHAKAFNNGISAVQAWLKPEKFEMKKSGETRNKVYKRKFNDGLDMLVHQTSLPIGLALKVMAAFPPFRKEANKRLIKLRNDRLKKKLQPVPGKVKTPDQLPGLTGGFPG